MTLPQAAEYVWGYHKAFRNKAIQEARLGIRAKYGKNSILKGMNYAPTATGLERSAQIGGHRA